MKTKFLFFILLCLSFSMNAQDIRIGLHGSPSISWMTSNDNKINGAGSNAGGSIGVIVERYWADNYAFTTGLSLSMNQGGILQTTYGGNFFKNSDLSKDVYYALPDNAQIRYKIQYIEIPMGLKMRSQEMGYFRYYANLPIFTLAFKTKARANISGEGLEEGKQENINKDIKPVNLFWGLGGGVEYSITEKLSLVGGFSFKMSMIDVTKNTGELNTGEKEDSKGTIGGVSLNIGLFF